MRNPGSHFLAVALACLSVAAACNREEPARDAANQPPAATGPAGETLRGTASDAAITTSLQARYYADDAIRGRDINVDTTGGVVTLKGTVENDHAKQRAVQIAREVEGVTQVEDQLQVAPATAGESAKTGERADATTPRERRPAWITTKIQAQYFVNPDIKPWNIDVSTQSNGTVTLRGEVDDANDRQRAVEIARTTEGVTRVEDELRVRGEQDADAVATTGDDTARDPAAEPAPPVRPIATIGDAWLTSKIQSKYFLDDEVKGHDIDVTTADGNVTLSGVVGSEAQRRQAVAIARNTDGVESVQDQLRVDPAARGRGVEPGAWQIGGVENPFADEWLKTKIESKFFMDDTVKAQKIAVQARDGIVTLTGEAQSEQARRAAEEIARGTAGVKQVQNQITIGGGAR